MPKYDEYGSIIRTYKVRCPECKQKIRVVEDDFTCEFCGTNICPECLTVLSTSYSSYGTDGGWDLSCVYCGYEIAGA